MIALPGLLGIIMEVSQPLAHERLSIVLLLATALCQWGALIVAQASFNRVWSTSAAVGPAVAGLPADPLWPYYRRQLSSSLACLLPVLAGLTIVVHEAGRVAEFLPAKGMRLEAIGHGSPVVKRSHAPGEVIEVMMPAASGTDHVRDLLQAGYVFEVREARGDLHRSEAEALAAVDNKIPDGWEILRGRGADQDEFHLCRRQPVLVGEDVQSAQAIEDEYGTSAAHIRLTQPAGERMLQYSRANLGGRLAIVLDKDVISDATITSEVGRDIQVAGHFSPAQARELSLVLQVASLSLPHPGMLTSEQVVSTTRWVVRQTVRAALFALGLVAMLILLIRIVPGRRAPIPAAG
jgi:preprotein translocase subunit SecD